MSDRMTPMAFSQLMTWVLEESRKGSIFGMKKKYKADPSRFCNIFGNKLETPVGPAAGPNTQLTQNIVASYVGGARFFELKTVQKLDGEDLPVSKPCILADDECYNCEWSTELYVPQAFDEYVKAWFMLKFIAKEFELGDIDGFQFNMSVGYDLEGIKLPKIDNFIEGMKEAKDTPIFKECYAWLEAHIDTFKNFTKEDLDSISSSVCTSATLSTLHGCPPDEIERIATYLLEEKNLHTFIKCNPTLLGYEYARKILDEMGYDYIQFTDLHFKEDLQFEDAVPMMERLMALAETKGLEFGVKITNTFPVDVKENQLPSEEMYMSGKSLYPLSLSVALKLSEAFNGKLRISYSGGADANNIQGLLNIGIWPVTMATTLLKPGGYERFIQVAEKCLEVLPGEFSGINVEGLRTVLENAKTDPYHVKPIKPAPIRKNGGTSPLIGCFVAPCEDTCPIHQDITSYGKLVNNGEYEKALDIILDKNPLPYITGTICNHACMAHCTRNYYESPVNIRKNKLIAAKKGYDSIISKIKVQKKNGKKVVIIGGGPAGIASAYFLARAGADVTVYDENEKLGGVVANIIPEFRISDSAIEKDISFAEAYGAKFVTGKKITDVKALMESEGAAYAIIAIGAHKEASLELSEGSYINAHKFLGESRKTNLNVDLGENVVVIGAGNTAMDTARAAKKNKGVKNVYIVYRRTKRYMPADEEELLEAIHEGVEFRELLAPVGLKDGKLSCKKMELGEIGADGRRGVKSTDRIVEIPCDTLIASLGEGVNKDFYVANGIDVDEKGRPVLDSATGETSVSGIYAAGDGAIGGSVVVKAIAGAMKCAEAILGAQVKSYIFFETDEDKIYDKRGIIREANAEADDRCLACNFICENCAQVCPNRANIAIKVPGILMHQIIHVDYMCNECGNCNSFCPFESAPYKAKLTLFANEKDYNESENEGFYFTDEKGSYKIRVNDNEDNYINIVKAVWKDYGYMVPRS